MRLIISFTFVIALTGILAAGGKIGENAESLENATINETQFTEEWSDKYNNFAVAEEWAEAVGITTAKLANGAARYSYNNPEKYGPVQLFNLAKYALYIFIFYITVKTLSLFGISYEVLK